MDTPFWQNENIIKIIFRYLIKNWIKGNKLKMGGSEIKLSFHCLYT